jgi:UDP-GlcNAc:undecaprenyl-phosphate/decaprenyl-phosphate GlcNAc-1-phosphate transferase
VSAAVSIAALPVAVLALLVLLRTRLGDRLVAEPSGERWHGRATPTFGGVGIALGLLAGVGLALAVGALDPSWELFGILAGALLLFCAGLLDDLVHLPPLVKLAAQVAAASIAVASGLTVELVESNWIAVPIALLWLVGITNAFNLLDNMDGLAATLAAIACAYFAVDAATEHSSDLVLVVALALGCACVGFLPFNLRPGGQALVFMGDSGSQLLGFTLAALGLASSWTVAGTTVATTVLPLLVLAIPILDTAFVTLVRIAQRRPVSQGGRDHTSHRLVYYGLSETRAVALLAALALALGATGVAYNIVNEGWVTVIGVLVTVVLLVQFASFLSDLEEQARAGGSGQPVPLVRALTEPRRLAEVLLDFGLMCGSFLAAYVLLVDGLGTLVQRAVFVASLPVVLALRYICFVVAGVYRRVWRFAGVHDAAAVAIACAVSAVGAYAVVRVQRGTLETFPWQVFLLDAVFSAVLVVAARIAVGRWLQHRDQGRPGTTRRVLVVGAGRTGRSFARELRETPGERAVGFLDDNPGVRRRRVLGVLVAGSLDEAAAAIAATAPDEVVVTIPDAPAQRLEPVVRACEEAGLECRFLRRQVEPGAQALVEAQVR